MNFMGIDLAWTYKNESGVCVISEKGRVMYCNSDIFSDEELAAIVNEYSQTGAIVAVDAPLIVNNETGTRKPERLLMRDKFHGKSLSLLPCNRKLMKKIYGCIRGENLVSAIRNGNPCFSITPNIRTSSYSLLETFPTGILLGLFPGNYPIKYKAKKGVKIEERKSELIRLIQTINKLQELENTGDYFYEVNIMSFSAVQLKHLEDKIDAFLCAYGAFWCHKNKGHERIYGD